MYNLFIPLIKIYKALYLFAFDITGNYGVALVLLSFFTFVVLYPFNKKAQQIQNKEHKIQSILAPQIAEIKNQYSGREQYEQLQWLYRRYGYHPLYAVRSALGFVLQIPFLTAAYYMLSELEEIQGVSWGFISNLGAPDHLLAGINLLPFVMMLVTCVYAFVMPEISKKERLQTIAIGFFFLVLLFAAPSALLIFWTCNLIWSLVDSVLSKKLERLRDFTAENELAFHIIFALSLTVGLLVPTEIYIRNASQLWFGYKDILTFFLTDTIKCFTVLFIGYIICWHKRIRNIYLSMLLGLLFGVFLQSYVISLNYGQFDGHEIEWDKYKKIGLINTFIWLFCFIVTWAGFKKLKFDSKKLSGFVKPITFGITIIQCVVLLLILKNTSLNKDVALGHGKAVILTTKNIYTASSHKNIIVFLLDMFDAAIFEEIEIKKPEVLVEFKDFTYYPDTISSFSFTNYSLPEILTGKLYNPAEWFPGYLEQAWKDNVYYKALADYNYNVTLYTSGNYVDRSAPVDNLVMVNAVMDAKTVDSFVNLVRFRIAPHYLKYLYYNYHPDMQIPTLDNSAFVPYEENDRNFYLGLKRGLDFSNDENAFRFYHLSGAHFPYVYDENMEYIKDGEKGNAYKQSIGCLKIVAEYISQLKKHNVYDNTTFVVMADHGYHNGSIGRRPVFLIKRAHEKNAVIAVNNKPQKVSDMLSLVLGDLLKIKAENIKEMKEPGYTTGRIYYHDNVDKGMSFERYLVKSPAKDIKSWVSLGMTERIKNDDCSYKIGEVIDFSCFGNSYKYKGNGWEGRVETFGSAIGQSEATLDLTVDNIEDLQHNLNIEIVCNPLLNHFPKTSKEIYRDLKLYANQKLVGSWHFTKLDTTAVSCEIPAGLLDNNNINLRFVISNPINSSQRERFQVNKIIIKRKW